MLWLPIAFFGVAFLYAMAGFGGGSTYIVLLVIAGLPLAVVPIISLICNCLVAGQGAWLLHREGHIRWRMLSPLLIGSLPAAFIGGSWRLSGVVFLSLLTLALTLAGLALLYRPKANVEPPPLHHPWAKLMGLGIVLGLIAGLTGIGGGIYLSPALHLLRWEKPRSICSAASVFIVLNSMAGLLGQLTKGIDHLAEAPPYLLWVCPLAVLIGGRLGSKQLADHLPAARIRTMTAIVVLLVAARLWLRLLSGG